MKGPFKREFFLWYVFVNINGDKINRVIKRHIGEKLLESMRCFY